MLYEEIKLKLYNVLNDAFGNNARFSDLQAEWAINQAVKDIIKLHDKSPYGEDILGSLLVDETLTVSSGAVTLTNEAFEIKGVLVNNIPARRLLNSSELIEAKGNAWKKPRGLTPYYSFTGGNSVKIYGVDDGESAEVIYIKNPTAFAVGVTPELNANYHDAIVWMSAHLLAKEVESGYENYTNTFFEEALKVLGILVPATQENK